MFFSPSKWAKPSWETTFPWFNSKRKHVWHSTFSFSFVVWKNEAHLRRVHPFIYLFIFTPNSKLCMSLESGVIRFCFFSSSSTWELRVDILWFNVPRGSYFLKLRMRFLFVWEWTGQHWWVSHHVLRFMLFSTKR